MLYESFLILLVLSNSFSLSLSLSFHFNRSAWRWSSSTSTTINLLGFLFWQDHWRVGCRDPSRHPGLPDQPDDGRGPQRRTLGGHGHLAPADLWLPGLGGQRGVWDRHRLARGRRERGPVLVPAADGLPVPHPGGLHRVPRLLAAGRVQRQERNGGWLLADRVLPLFQPIA